jgi:hypothetical protein
MLRVTGTVTSPDGPAGNTGVRLIPADADEFSADASDATQATTNAAGAFTFLGVAPGDYVLKVVKVPRAAMAMSEILIEGPGGMVGMMGSSVGSATAPLPTEATYWASVPVSVTNKDLRDVTVTLHAGVHISGHAVFEGTAAHPPAQTVAKMPINIDPAFGTVGVVASPRAQFDEAGQFASQGVPAGKYVMRASSGSPSWTLKSVMSQGRDVSEVPLDVSLSDITDVVVTFTDEPIELSGTIRDAKDAPDPTATLILFPVNPDERVSYGPIARRIKTVRATTSGTYKLPNLVAGDYFVAAVRDETITDAQDPAFLTALVAFATRVTLVEGDKKTQDVKTGQVK